MDAAGDMYESLLRRCDNLTRENAKLRKALREIEATKKGYQDVCWELARKALAADF
jgi:prefoldin subunit 5